MTAAIGGSRQGHSDNLMGAAQPKEGPTAAMARWRRNSRGMTQS
jgi:hypothetical protein